MQSSKYQTNLIKDFDFTHPIDATITYWRDKMEKNKEVKKDFVPQKPKINVYECDNEGKAIADSGIGMWEKESKKDGKKFLAGKHKETGKQLIAFYS